MFVVLAAIGCHDPFPAGRASPAVERFDPAYYPDVERIINRRCAHCHFAGGIGTIPLLSYVGVRALAPVAAEAVRSGRMPPWPPSRAGLPLLDDPSLSDEEKATFLRWVERGAREGDPSLHQPYLAPPQQIREDISVVLPEPFVSTQVGDDYRCFMLDPRLEQDRFVTAFRARPGNAAIVHHMVLYALPPIPGLLKTAMELDAADAAPGFSCWGGPALEADDDHDDGDDHDRQPNDAQPPLRMVGSWKPGQSVQRMPAGTGVLVPAQARLILEMHYHAPARGQTDTTGIDLELASGDVSPGSYYRITDRQLLIPLGARDLYVEPSARVGERIPAGRLLGAFLHMHLYGKSIALELNEGGQPLLLLDIPRWDPGWQGNYSFAAPVSMAAGDRLLVRCRYDNLPDSQPVVNGTPVTPHNVAYGPGALDEMCQAFLYVAP